MYARERVRVVQTFGVGLVIGIAGLVLIVMAALKIEYNTWLRGLTILLYQSFPPFRWAWPWLPDVGATALSTIMLNVSFLLAVCLLFIGAAFTGNARNYHSIIKEAVRKSRVAGLVDRRGNSSYRQSVGPISAGGDVTIQQIADANRKLDEWDQSFWKGPLGGIVLSVVAIIIAVVITNLTGLTH